MTLRLWLAVAAGLAALTCAVAIYVNHLQDELRKAQAGIVRAESAALASAREASAERLSAQRVEIVVRQARAAEAATASLAIAAHEAPDANDPLAPDRVLRLRNHDDELCRLSPGLCAAAPIADPADSPGALRAAPAP